MSIRKLTLALCVAAGGALPLHAQTQTAQPAPPQTPQPPAAVASAPAQPAAVSASAVDGGQPVWIRPETAEQRKLRLGTTEDPGPDPDPKKGWERYGHRYFIEKADRRWGNFYNPPGGGWIRAFGFVHFYRGAFPMKERRVGIWQPGRDETRNRPQPEAGAQEPKSLYTGEAMDCLMKLRGEFTPLGAPASDGTVHFEESSQGLPSAGSWRNSLAVADMNEDGCPDIVAPPERGIPNGVPSIFLGDCQGHWTYWKDVKLPRSLEYGY